MVQADVMSKLGIILICRHGYTLVPKHWVAQIQRLNHIRYNHFQSPRIRRILSRIGFWDMDDPGFWGLWWWACHLRSGCNNRFRVQRFQSGGVPLSWSDDPWLRWHVAVRHPDLEIAWNTTGWPAAADRQGSLESGSLPLVSRPTAERIVQ